MRCTCAVLHCHLCLPRLFHIFRHYLIMAQFSGGGGGGVIEHKNMCFDFLCDTTADGSSLQLIAVVTCICMYLWFFRWYASSWKHRYMRYIASCIFKRIYVFFLSLLREQNQLYCRAHLLLPVTPPRKKKKFGVGGVGGPPPPRPIIRPTLAFTAGSCPTICHAVYLLCDFL